MAHALVVPDPSAVDPIVLRRQLLADGLTDKAIARLVANGTLHRVRHGAYVDAALWRAADGPRRHALHARAVLRQAKADIVLSHTTALNEWGVPWWDLTLTDVHVTRTDRRAGRKEAGVCQHLGELHRDEVEEQDGIALTNPTRSGLDALCLMDVEHGVTVISDLLHRGLTEVEKLRECRARMQRWPGTLTHDLVLRLADGRFESVGESRTAFLCWRQGVPRPVPQYVIRDHAGREVARVDFAWPELGVYLEFDGRAKYERLLRPGESPVDVVMREKQREDLIHELTGWRCIRITWADLYRPAETAARIMRMLGARPATR